MRLSNISSVGTTFVIVIATYLVLLLEIQKENDYEHYYYQ